MRKRSVVGGLLCYLAFASTLFWLPSRSVNMRNVKPMSDSEKEISKILQTIVLFCGIFFSLLAILTIQRARYLQNSFGAICTFQMVCDIAKIGLASAFALIPDAYAPASESPFAISVAVTAEIFYFSSCLMHVLFAIHRLIFIVFPKRKEVWASYTSHAIGVCVLFATLKSLLPQMLNKDLYLFFDRDLISWLFTSTPRTMITKMALSYSEVVIVFILDSISFAKLLKIKATISTSIWDANKAAEAKLVVQSLLQCWPTLTMVFFYFHVMPTLQNAFLIFLCSLTWNISNAMDGMIIIMLHTRKQIFMKAQPIIGMTTMQGRTTILMHSTGH